MFCANAVEALGAEAHETLFRIAGEYLEKSRLLAVELAFDPREHKKLLNSGTKFQEFVSASRSFRASRSRPRSPSGCATRSPSSTRR
jgi:hypothetical protein